MSDSQSYFSEMTFKVMITVNLLISLLVVQHLVIHFPLSMSPRESFTNPWLFQEVRKESTKEAVDEEVSSWHCAFDA